MPKVVTQKVVHKGMSTITTQKLSDSFSAYTDDVVSWTGSTAFSFKPTRTQQVLASGDDPAWAVVNGYVVGDVEMTFYGIPIDKMEELLSVKYSAADGVCVGDFDDPARFVGVMCDNKVEGSSGANSTNRTILYKVLFSLPEISNQTMAEGEVATATVTVTGKAYPVFYTGTNGVSGARTYAILNSTTNAAKFKANDASIVFPTAMTTGS